MTAQERFELMLTRDVAPRLAEHGFRRSRGTLRRPAHGGWEVITFQRSQSANARSIPFTVEVGVEPGPLITGTEAWTPRGWPLITECSFRDRVFHLAEGRDRWRKVRSWLPAVLVTRAVLRAIDETGLPWLEERSDPARAVDADDGPVPLGNADARERLRAALR